jgi:hypothetical protein
MYCATAGNGELRSVSGPPRDEVKRTQEKTRNEEVSNL